MIITRVLVPLFLLFLASPANALVLRGLAAEVPNGNTIVIMSNGQRLTIFLKGVDAPELKQEFGDVAREHLASLILGKTVEVEVDELAAEHVVGRVIFDRMDIGLQVIRDGVAWYDTKKVNSLSEEERRAYVRAEQAARADLRGIWQNGSPMPPWEWRRAQLAKQYKLVRTKPGQGLTREDILFKNKHSRTRGSGRAPGKPTARPLNRPGQDYDFTDYLKQGRISIVYFYADWCPSCRALNPRMDRINSQVATMQVLFMDIGTWNTPVTQRYAVTYVPYLKIFDKTGNLVAEGKAAHAWLQKAMQGRM